MVRAEPRVLAAFALVVVIAGINFVAVKFSNQELPPFAGAALRFFLAALLLLIWCIGRKIPLPEGRAFLTAALFGLVAFGMAYALAYYSLLGLASGLLAVIMASVPVITILLASVQGIEKFRIRGLAGALVALLGIAVILNEQLTFRVEAKFLAAGLGVAICAAQSSLLAKRGPKSNPFAFNAVAMLIGAAFLALVSSITHERPLVPDQVSTLTALLYLATIGSVGLFVLFIYVLTRWTASATSYQLVLSPIVTVLVANWLLSESITWVFVGGGLIVAAGVLLAIPRGAPAPASAAPTTQSAASTTDARGP